MLTELFKGDPLKGRAKVAEFSSNLPFLQLHQEINQLNLCLLIRPQMLINPLLEPLAQILPLPLVPQLLQLRLLFLAVLGLFVGNGRWQGHQDREVGRVRRALEGLLME